MFALFRASWPLASGGASERVLEDEGFEFCVSDKNTSHHACHIHSQLLSLFTMVFIFGFSERHSIVLQSGIGPCQFCFSTDVDLIKKETRFWLFRCIPTPPVTHRMVVCRSCRKCIKAEYYYSNTSVMMSEKGVSTTTRDQSSWARQCCRSQMIRARPIERKE